MQEQIFDKIMHTMLEIEFTQKDCVETAKDIYFGVISNKELFSKHQTWFISSRTHWFVEMVWKFQNIII